MGTAAGALTPAESLRYARQLLLPGFDATTQQRLKGATALVAGVGGLGGTAALYLAAAGIGRLVIVHEGPLELPDLNRQILMQEGWLGRQRVECARDFFRRFHSGVEVVALADRVGTDNLDGWLGGADVALDCRHNFPERYALNAACVRLGRPMVEAAMNAMEAYLTVVVPRKTACLACLYPEAPADWDHLGFPVLGAVPGVLGSLAAIEAIKVITGWGRPLTGTMLAMDLGDGEFRSFRLGRRPVCAVCGGG